MRKKKKRGGGKGMEMAFLPSLFDIGTYMYVFKPSVRVGFTCAGLCKDLSYYDEKEMMPSSHVGHRDLIFIKSILIKRWDWCLNPKVIHIWSIRTIYVCPPSTHEIYVSPDMVLPIEEA